MKITKSQVTDLVSKLQDLDPYEYEGYWGVNLGTYELDVDAPDIQMPREYFWLTLREDIVESNFIQDIKKKYNCFVIKAGCCFFTEHSVLVVPIDIIPSANEELQRGLLNSSRDLAIDIDQCIVDLIKARLAKDKEAEGKALCQMESLMTASEQQLCCMIDYLGGNVHKDQRKKEA